MKNRELGETLRPHSEIIITPRLEGDATDVLPILELIKVFNPSLFRGNLGLIQACRKECTTQDSRWITLVLEETNLCSQLDKSQIIRIVKGLKKAPDGLDSAINLIGGNYPANVNEIGLSTFYADVLDTNSDRSVCFITSNHGHDAYLAHTLEQAGVDLGQVGWLVFDRHPDFYIPIGNTLPDKSNFLNILLDPLGIGAIGVIGINQELIQQIITGKLTASTGEELDILSLAKDAKNRGQVNDTTIHQAQLGLMHKIYKFYQGRLNIDHNIFDTQGQTTQECLTEALSRQLQLFSQAGIRQVFCSICLDVIDDLEAQTTAIDYSSWNTILLLGVQDLYCLWNSLKGPYSDIKTFAQARPSAFNRFLQEISLTTQALRHPIKEAQNLDLNLHTRTPRGVTREQMINLMQSMQTMCHAYNLELGIVVNGKRIIGSINELTGLDFEGKTAKLAFDCASCLLHN
ncbi:hypothetical protein GYA49_04755 [Candidatus Beckwithbacteria bacterium]|nr:hypothetical protein [Candidatus Beckwithbacteria bacterium]